MYTNSSGVLYFQIKASNTDRISSETNHERIDMAADADNHPLAVSTLHKLGLAGINSQAAPAPAGATRYGIACMVESGGYDLNSNSDAIVAHILATTGNEGHFYIQFQLDDQNGTLSLVTDVWHWDPADEDV
jgi:hypothetical protein